ncbi:MAG: beta galactosidase jelly roll domain-containing protein, partial [Alphaproteobacteria bacterium]|nr:beta galactosidase jelly roll domain-containing protein [Alphaproteobacteria bacterium]
MANTETIHPRPQLRRAVWTELGGKWQFCFDDADRGRAEHWQSDAKKFDRTIVVPFPPESPASGVGETGEHPVLWYRRTFSLDAGSRTERLRLHFGAVDYHAQVWLNGHFLGEHQGGHTPFHFEIGHLVSADAEQTLVVRVFDDPHDLAQPRGKQHWRDEPATIYHQRTSGIWQPVWLEPLDRCSVETIKWTPDFHGFGVALEMTLSGATVSASKAHIRLNCAGQTLVDDVCSLGDGVFSRKFFFDPRFGANAKALGWTPDHPNLIAAEIEILDQAGKSLDRIESYFGLRSIEVADGRFVLNGVPTFLRLVLAQNYWPESHLAAPSPAAMMREVELAKALGFNGMRIHQKIEDPRFLYWCDRLGMMVWGEAASAHVFSRESVERLTAEWQAAVKRDYSHPSIVAWVPFNESWGVPDLDHESAQRDFVRALYHLTRALDPTRPVIANDGWQHLGGEMLGIHDYSPKGAELRARYGSAELLQGSFRSLRPWHKPLFSGGHQYEGQPVIISEFGGLSLALDGERKSFGYGTATDPVALLDSFEELIESLLASTAVAGFCYTQLTDTEQENNGLLTAARTHKLDAETIRDITTRPT